MRRNGYSYIYLVLWNNKRERVEVHRYQGGQKIPQSYRVFACKKDAMIYANMESTARSGAPIVYHF